MNATSCRRMSEQAAGTAVVGACGMLRLPTKWRLRPKTATEGVTSNFRRRFGGCLSRRWELGFQQSSLGRIVRVSRHPALDASRRTPLPEHAVVPSRFRAQVSPATQEPPSKFIPTASGTQRSASRRTLDQDVHRSPALHGHPRLAHLQRQIIETGTDSYRLASPGQGRTGRRDCNRAGELAVSSPWRDGELPG
jgi:hypothetical protein